MTKNGNKKNTAIVELEKLE